MSMYYGPKDYIFRTVAYYESPLGSLAKWYHILPLFLVLCFVSSLFHSVMTQRQRQSETNRSKVEDKRL